MDKRAQSISNIVAFGVLIVVVVTLVVLIISGGGAALVYYGIKVKSNWMIVLGGALVAVAAAMVFLGVLKLFY
jgi:hypothetical protein